MPLPLGMRAAPPCSRSLTGVQRLWYALVCDAVDTIRMYPRSKAAARDRAWIGGASAPLDFDDLCAALDLDTDAVREALPQPGRTLRTKRAWVQHGLRKYATA